IIEQPKHGSLTITNTLRGNEPSAALLTFFVEYRYTPQSDFIGEDKIVWSAISDGVESLQGVTSIRVDPWQESITYIQNDALGSTRFGETDYSTHAEQWSSSYYLFGEPDF